jgi:hypothetical protein
MKKRKRGRPKGKKNRDKQKDKLKTISIEKAKLIKTIWKLQPMFKDLQIDLTKFTTEILEKHIRFIKRRIIK